MAILLGLLLRFQDAPMATPPVTAWEMANEPLADRWLTLE